MKLLITYLQQYGEINRMMTTKNGLFSKFREENYFKNIQNLYTYYISQRIFKIKVLR
jgi:hypothetical protein